MTASVIKIFDNGWGSDVPLKQVEQRIVDQWLSQESGNIVIINSTWYTQEYHHTVMSELKQLEFDQIVLVSMLDAAIPQPKWYQEFDCAVRALGYYRGADTVDFWALVVNKYFQMPDYDCTEIRHIDTAYMCLNRKPHWHRQKLYNQLTAQGILDQGLVSFGGDNSPALKCLIKDSGESDLAPNSGKDQHGINNDIMSLGHPENWQRHFLNIVTETQYDIQSTYFVSEKIYKPIVGFRPFLVYAGDGAKEWLTERGFEPYVNDFADITDLDLAQPENIAEFLKVLCQQNSSYWQSKYLALKDKILYNNSNFYTYIKGIKCQI
jgi:hypothetical protein